MHSHKKIVLIDRCGCTTSVLECGDRAALQLKVDSARRVERTMPNQTVTCFFWHRGQHTCLTHWSFAGTDAALTCITLKRRPDRQLAIQTAPKTLRVSDQPYYLEVFHQLDDMRVLLDSCCVVLCFFQSNIRFSWSGLALGRSNRYPQTGLPLLRTIAVFSIIFLMEIT